MSGRRLTEQTQFDWNEPEDVMRDEKRIYRSGRPHHVWNNPAKSKKANVSIKAEKRTHPSGSLQIYWDNPEDTIQVEDDIKVGKGNGSAKNRISVGTISEKKY